MALHISLPSQSPSTPAPQADLARGGWRVRRKPRAGSPAPSHLRSKIIAAALEHLVARGWQLEWLPEDRVLLAPPGEELGARSWSLDQAVAIAGLVGFVAPAEQLPLDLPLPASH